MKYLWLAATIILAMLFMISLHEDNWIATGISVFGTIMYALIFLRANSEGGR